MPGNEAVAYGIADGVATITLSRPERLNAVDAEMFRGLMDTFDRTDSDDGVRAVVVTGAGRAFCAGADLSQGSGTFDHGEDASGPAAHRDMGGLLALRIYRSLKPVIAAVNGPAVGVGASMTLPMDVRILADTARIGFVYVRRGIVPEGASSWFLPRLVGIGKALEWCLAGRMVSAEEALAAGLARTVCPAGDVLATATALAREIAVSAAPVSAVITRHLLWQMLGVAHPMEAHRAESRAVYDTGRMADAAEGIAAFLSRREPSWSLAPSEHLPSWFPWRPEPPFAG
jgi:enoyl-CoA hydratase/carnithine racemase